jgi:ribosomal protein S27E
LRNLRRHERFIRRLEVECSARDENTRGISSNFSLGGLFIRTNRPFSPGTLVDLNIHLPDGGAAKATGRVKTAQKTALASLKNGMGIEIIEKDLNYVTFIKSLGADSRVETGEAASTRKRETPGDSTVTPDSGSAEFFIIPCPHCGVRNKVRTSRSSPGMKCGKCGNPLRTA